MNHLSAEVDVFCEWIDECHNLNTGKKQRGIEAEEDELADGEEY